MEARAAPEDQRVEDQSIRENLTIVETQDDLSVQAQAAQEVQAVDARAADEDLAVEAQAVHDARE